jgi:predicted short-subunit dehydrogenase-like oxidoreductase (DUF2520 family)
MPRISILGVGRVGGALGVALSRKGVVVSDLIFRSPGSLAEVIHEIHPTPHTYSSVDDLKLDSDILLIATGDSEIANVAEHLASVSALPPVVLHTSGSLGVEVLGSLRERGCVLGSMHPLLSISDPISGSRSFEGAFFCIEGDELAKDSARLLVETLAGRTIEIGSDKRALYHAAAVMACGHLTALVDLAVKMLAECDVEHEDGLAILLPLINSTISNMSEKGIDRALTGPYSRFDETVMDRHLDSMTRLNDADLIQIYLLLAERSVEIAERRGGDSAAAKRLRERISMAKESSK